MNPVLLNKKMRGMAARVPKVPGAKDTSPAPNQMDRVIETFPEKPACLKVLFIVKLSDRNFDFNQAIAGSRSLEGL